MLLRPTTVFLVHSGGPHVQHMVGGAQGLIGATLDDKEALRRWVDGHCQGAAFDHMDSMGAGMMLTAQHGLLAGWGDFPDEFDGQRIDLSDFRAGPYEEPGNFTLLGRNREAGR